MDIKLISTAVTLHFFALITPGPDFVLTVRNTLQFGRISGLATSVGLGLGIALHVSYCIAGIAVLLKEFPSAANFLRHAGALYLIWIGISGVMALRKNPQKASLEAPTFLSPKGVPESLAQGFLTNILNPKATLFILGLYTSVLKPGTSLTTLITTGSLMVLMTIMWFFLVTIFFSAETIRRGYQRIELFLNVLFGLFFVGVGVALLFN